MATAMGSGRGCGRYGAANDDKDPNISQVLRIVLIHEIDRDRSLTLALEPSDETTPMMLVCARVPHAVTTLGTAHHPGRRMRQQGCA